MELIAKFSCDNWPPEYLAALVQEEETYNAYRNFAHETLNYREVREYDIVGAKYGKSGVRLLHVERSAGGGRETAREVEVSTRLVLDSRKDYTDADNGDIIATDSQKNVLQALAKKYGIPSPEEFALLSAKFFLSKYPRLVEASVTVVEVPWRRHVTPDGPHRHAFVHSGGAERWASVTQTRSKGAKVRSGLRGLQVLKTTRSSFSGFLQDEFRTLPDAEDRIFSTAVAAEWTYLNTSRVDFHDTWFGVLSSILDVFAGPPQGVDSPSVQNTLYLSCVRVLDTLPQVSRIEMTMPNRHYLNVDLTPFPEELVGGGVNRSVYLPVERPSGYIQAALSRNDCRPKL